MSDLDRVLARIDADLDRSLDRLFDYLRIKSISTDPAFKDDCRAEKYFGKAASFTNAPTYIARLHARAQEKCGDLQSAYQYWYNLWNQDHAKVDQPWNIVERELRRLEDVMNLPDNQRVFPKKVK